MIAKTKKTSKPDTGLRVRNPDAIGQNIVIKRDEAEQRSKGGIVLPQNAQQIANRGTVVSIGLGIDDEDYGDLAVGDHIAFSGYGFELKVDDVSYVVVHIKDVLVVLPE